jgi:hypothetical protein
MMRLHEDSNGSCSSSMPQVQVCEDEITMKILADLVLFWNSEAFICHTQILASRSSVLSNLISIALNSESYDESSGLLKIQIGISAPTFVQETKRQATFLKHLYSFEQSKISGFEEAAELITLADYFGCTTAMRKIELFCCNTCINHLQCPRTSSLNELCDYFSLSMTHRLTRLAALLLPWTLSKLNRGPLADSSTPVWKDIQARLDVLRNAMGPDIRSIALDIQWWSCGMPQRCETCECRSRDMALILHPSYIQGLGNVPYTRTIISGTNFNTVSTCIINKLPESYLSVSAHIAHSLAESKWGMTPATSFSGSFRPS